MDKQKTIKVLDMISSGMENDIKEFEGKPFTGRTVGALFGKQAAAIQALANIMKSILTE